MKNSNTTPEEITPIELPATAFGCSPREATAEDDNLLKLLIGRLDELTRPGRPGRLK
ncbi:hypothetical protein ACLQ8T_05990 [Glutamicibacter sp. FR1]|uniref:hypothetical protein n=1 Tax=Glutamicibacter sp. FR1 TaxID=3393744 RepID=UPI0039B07470